MVAVRVFACVCGCWAYGRPCAARPERWDRNLLAGHREQVVQLMEVDGRETAIRYMPCCGASRV